MVLIGKDPYAVPPEEQRSPKRPHFPWMVGAPSEEQLIRRCRHFQWMVGMLGHRGGRVVSVEDGWVKFDNSVGQGVLAESVEDLPVLTDETTVKCLYTLLVNVHGPDVAIVYDHDHWCVYINQTRVAGGDTYVSAIINALRT